MQLRSYFGAEYWLIICRSGLVLKFWRRHIADLTAYFRAGNASVVGFKVPEGAPKVQVERLGLFSFYGIKRCTGLELWTHVIVSYSAVEVMVRWITNAILLLYWSRILTHNLPLGLVGKWRARTYCGSDGISPSWQCFSRRVQSPWGCTKKVQVEKQLVTEKAKRWLFCDFLKA